MHPDGKVLAEIAGLIDEKVLKNNITQTFPLEGLGKVHKLSLAGKTKGKVLVRVKNQQENFF